MQNTIYYDDGHDSAEENAGYVGMMLMLAMAMVMLATEMLATTDNDDDDNDTAAPPMECGATPTAWK